ncbi:MAG TPA: accessory factor UbiK family protein [Geminicoccaceae bacterium]|nr:accessory factor UbiK family protein [Geminicoccus sp.]HMU52502.1 accessory factor UbiK family protein [Geminicoccaceae bacterium]
MQTESRIFDDIARVASGALSALGGVKDEIETRVRERVERLAAEMELCTREELDAAKAVAVKARAAQEDLEAKVAALEARVAALESPPAPARRPRVRPKPAAGA